MTIRENLNHGKQRSSRRRASISGLFSTRGSSTISTPSPSPRKRGGLQHFQA